MQKANERRGVNRYAFRAAAVAGALALGCSSSNSNSGQGGATSTGGSAGADDGSTMGQGGANQGQGGGGPEGSSDSGGSASIDASIERGAGGSVGVLDASREATHPGAVRIMAVGDSITRATCWRGLLWQHLNQNYASRFDLVGTLSNDPGCGLGSYDMDNQGYSSSLLTEVVAGITTARVCDPNPCPSLNVFRTAFATAMPDVVLVHYGTNDVWNAKPTSQITSAYSTLIDAVREANPYVVVLVAQIIPMNVTSATCSGCSCAGCATAIPAFNSALASLAISKSTDASPVIVVDQYTGFDAIQDTRDGVHPNTQGSQKMADLWYAALTSNYLIP